MIQKIVDFIVLLFASILSVNAIIIALVGLCHLLKRRIYMLHLSQILKGVIIYLFFPLPLFMAYQLYILSYKGTIQINSADLSNMRIIGNKPLSMFASADVLAVSKIIFFIWWLGILWFGIRRFLRIQNLFKRLEKSGELANDAVFNEIAANFLNTKVKLYKSASIPIPFTFGLIKKRIFIPISTFSEQELRLIYEHELTHCKKFDYFYRNLMFVLCTIYWFNPGIYYLADLFVDINEMACDEIVLLNKDKGQRYSYASLIYRLSTEKKDGMNTIVCFTGTSSNNLERRIMNMKRTCLKRESFFTAMLLATMAFLCPATTFAASLQVSKLQNDISNKLIKNTAIEETSTVIKYIEHYEEINIDELTNTLSFSVGLRGASEIDVTIEPQAGTTANLYHLSKGAKIHLFLLSSTSGSFKAGLTDSSGKIRYVNSSGGEINHTFTVGSSGDYKVYIENTSSEQMNISGTIYISN